MMTFFSGPGVGGFEIQKLVMNEDEFLKLKGNACRLLKARNSDYAASLLESIPFTLSEGTNFFGDEFSVLHASVPIEKYIELTEMKGDPKNSVAFREISAVFGELGIYVRHIAAEIAPENVALVSQPKPDTTTAAVERALKDSQQLLYSSGAASAVDRVHTAIHGYLRAVCLNSNIPFNEQASLTELFKALRTQHPVFTQISTASEETKRIFGALSTIVDTLNSLRNNASIAHPNDQLLNEAEAILAINCTRSILHYLDAKLK